MPQLGGAGAGIHVDGGGVNAFSIYLLQPLDQNDVKSQAASAEPPAEAQKLAASAAIQTAQTPWMPRIRKPYAIDACLHMVVESPGARRGYLSAGPRARNL
ncbi:MAG: hypothetical protein VW405_03245 [Rhodospirillaceae bacterium]